MLRGAEDLELAVAAIRAERAAGHAVVAVVSAFGGTTDALLAEARAAELAPAPFVSLVASGEGHAAAELGAALAAAGIAAGSLRAEETGITTTGARLDAAPVGFDPAPLTAELARAPVVVLPGFVAPRADGTLSLLGRGGSDLTAVFVAGHLRAARCVLFKDVDGLYEWDPLDAERGTPRRYARATWADVLALPERVVQHKAVHAARALGVRFELGGWNGAATTHIGSEPAHLVPLRS